MLIGLGIGGGIGTAWCIGAIADDSAILTRASSVLKGSRCSRDSAHSIGLAVDAVIPGKVRVVYQAPLSQEASPASLTVVPLFSSRVKGLAISFAF